jgi:hypothetical protein
VLKAFSTLASNSNRRTKSIIALAAILMLVAPFCFSAAFAQTEPPPPGQQWPADPGSGALSPGAQGTEATARQFPDEPPTNYVNQVAEQNKDIVIQNVEALLTDNFRQYNETYVGLHTFWGDDIISQLFANIGQLIGKWLTEFINGWVSDAVQFLTGFLRVFVLNPNVAVNGMSNVPGGGSADDISPFIRQGADVMYGIAVDLLLLLFILCIWKYWAEAAWRGGGNLVGAVGRLIFTAGLMLAWPTIYAFEIQITNEMIKAVYFNSADQVSALDAAMAAAVKGGLLAGAGLIANATAPVAGQAFGGLLGAGPGGIALGTVGNLVAFAGLIIYLILGGILIAELVYILVLKAIQTALLTAQYMFAPIFIVFFATPDTENVTSGFVRSFVEVSLWTFVWVGLLKIFVIMILSDFNPWGKIILAVGILQMMIQVPSFLARAQISPMSDFISAGLISGGLMKGGKFLGDTLSQRGMQLAKFIGGDTTTGAARGPEMSKKAELQGLAHGPRDPHLLKATRDAARGGPGGGTGPKGDKSDGTTMGADGKPIKPGGPGAVKPGDTPPKKPEDAKKPGDPTGASAAGATLNPITDAAKKGGLAAGVAAGAGAAMAATGAAGALNRTGTGSDEDAKRARAEAEQAAMAAKKLENEINAGLVGDDKDKDKQPKGPQLVDGKEIKQGAGEDKNKTGADLASALANKGLVPPTGKGADGKGTAGAEGQKDITTPVDKTIKPAGPGGAKSGVTPPTPDGKDLAALSPDGKKDGAGAMGPDGRPLNMDVEEGAASAGVPGVKLAPGATVGGAEKKDSDLKPPSGNLSTKTPGLNAAGPEGTISLPSRRPGAESKPATNSPDPTIQGLGRSTGQPTQARNIDPTTGIGDDTATDANGAAVDAKLPPALKPGDKTDVKEMGGAAGGADGKIPVTVSLPGRRVQAPTGNLGAKVEGTEAVTPGPDGQLKVQPGTVAAAGEGWTPEATVGEVKPATGSSAAGPGAKVEVQPTLGAGLPGLGGVVPIPVSRRGGRNAGPQVHGFIDPGWEPDDAPARPPAGMAGGGGIGGGGGGGMAPPPDDGRTPHGQAPPSPHEQRLQATQSVVPMDNYQQSGYRWIPPRGISGGIRLAQDVTLGPSTSGQPELLGNSKGQTFHVRHAEGMDPDRLALQMMTAGYATLVGNDPVAYDAARQSAIDAGADKPKGFAQRMAAGILSYNGGSWAQTANAKQAFQQALYTESVAGSQAYVNGQSGNAYTQYLNQRYGPMSAEQQAWGVHIMTDAGSPESSWHWGHIPATETLVRNAIPINATSRAIATNATVLRSRPWEQRAAISGCSAYMEARKNDEIPDAHQMVQDAWVGREAQLLPPAVVNAATALTAEFGDDACRDVKMVNDVANIVGAGADQKDYVQTFQAMRAVQGIGNSVKNGGGGFGGGSAPMMRGGGGGGGGGGGSPMVSTNVSGTVLPGGGGAENVVDVPVDVDPSGGGVGSLNLGGITPPAMGGAGAGTRANVTFRQGANPNAGAPPTQQMRIQGNTHPGATGPIHINNVGGVGAPPPLINEQNVEVEIVPGHVPTPPPLDPSLIKVPPAASSRPTEIRANVTFTSGGSGGGGNGSGPTQRVRFEAPLRDSTPQVNMQMGGYNAPGNEGQIIEQHVEGELMFSRTGDIGGIDPGEVESNLRNMVNQYDTTAEMAYNVVYDLHSAGFSYQQLSDPKIAKVAMQVMATDKSMAHTAAVTAGKLGGGNFSMVRTQVVQAMMDCDPKWNENNVDPKSIFAAEAIHSATQEYRTELLAEYADDIANSPEPAEHPVVKLQSYPTKNFVNQVISHPDYSGKPGAALHKQVVRVIRDKVDQRLAGKDPYYGGSGRYDDSDDSYSPQGIASSGRRSNYDIDD